MMRIKSAQKYPNLSIEMSPVLLKTKDNKYISEIMQNTSHLIQVSSKRKLFAHFESFRTNPVDSKSYSWFSLAITEDICAILAIEPSYDNKH